MLLTGKRKEQIRINTPKGITLNLDVQQISMEDDVVSCAIEKDGGDDPDVTKGSLVFAQVTRTETPGIIIDGGHGVGRVTKRGLDQPVGAAAINSVPRQMIRENLEEVCHLTDYHGGLSVVISVPGGEQLAKKTFNPRLGIIGGISILGTTGIVEPMSEQALVDTIRVELRQRKANGAEYVLLTPGNYGSDYIQKDIGIDPKIAVLTSNFIGEALDICKELKFQGALLIGHVGKLVKIAGGMLNTHSKYGDCRMDIMAAHAGAAGLPGGILPGPAGWRYPLRLRCRRAVPPHHPLHCPHGGSRWRRSRHRLLKQRSLVRVRKAVGGKLPLHSLPGGLESQPQWRRSQPAIPRRLGGSPPHQREHGLHLPRPAGLCRHRPAHPAGGAGGLPPHPPQ